MNGFIIAYLTGSFHRIFSQIEKREQKAGQSGGKGSVQHLSQQNAVE